MKADDKSIDHDMKMDASDTSRDETSESNGVSSKAEDVEDGNQDCIGSETDVDPQSTNDPHKEHLYE